MSTTTPHAVPLLVRRVRRAWGHAHPVLQVLIVAAAYFALLTLVFLDDPRSGPGGVTFRLVISVGMGVVAIASRRLRARRWRSAPHWVAVSEAMEDGRLTEGADRVAWRGAVERRRTEVAQEPRIVMAVLVLLVILFAALALTSAASPLQYGFLAFLAVWAAWLVATRGRRLARLDALLLPLEHAAAEEDARRAAWDPPAPSDRIPPAAG